jgi:hypothetical protein
MYNLWPKMSVKHPKPADERYSLLLSTNPTADKKNIRSD